VSESLQLVTPPAAEPVSLGDFKELLRIARTDTSRDTTLTRFLVAARLDCENWCRIKLITQTWLARLDSFPGSSVVYDRNGYPEFKLPNPPFQSIQFFRYVDTQGAVQTLPRDSSYGNNVAGPLYYYQLERGGGVMPARVAPAWATPWAPQRRLFANTVLQFRCGFGGPLQVSMTAGSRVLSSPGFIFNPDDAPLLSAEVGTKVCIPGAGPLVGSVATDLSTHVASVDANGVATLADAAVGAVTNVQAWIGERVPEELKLSILFHAQFFYEQSAVVDLEVPCVVESLRSPYRNLVS